MSFSWRLAAGAVAVPAVVVAGSASAEAQSAGGLSARVPVIPVECAHVAKCVLSEYRPGTFSLQREDFTLDAVSSQVTGIRWTRWDNTSARGTGKLYISEGGGSSKPCLPSTVRDCTNDLGQVTLVFSRASGGKFTRLHMTGQHDPHRVFTGVSPQWHWGPGPSYQVRDSAYQWLPYSQ
jgi:hypothetical protein